METNKNHITNTQDNIQHNEVHELFGVTQNPEIINTYNNINQQITGIIEKWIENRAKISDLLSNLKYREAVNQDIDSKSEDSNIESLDETISNSNVIKLASIHKQLHQYFDKDAA